MKRLVTILMLLAMLVGVAGCATTPEETAAPEAAAPTDAVTAPEPTAETVVEPTAVVEEPVELYSDKEFRAAMTASPQSLDEGYSTNAHTRQVSPFIFETLFTFGEGFEVIPQLVDTYTMSEDGLEYVFTLRQGVKFHDGSDFTAEDVVASIERYKTTVQAGAKLNAVTGMEILSDYEVKFTLDSPIGLLPALAFPQRPVMMPKEVADRNMGTELKGEDVIGTGPYKLVEWVPDVHIKLERFEDYVVDERYDDASGLGGQRIAYFKTIFLLPVPESEARMAGLETGEFDYAESIPATSYDRITGNTDLQASIVIPRWSVALEFNHTNFPSSDVNFRKALAYALDMEKVLTAITAGNTDFYRLDPSIYTPEQFYFTEAGSADIYNKPDPAKVAELLTAANYNGEEVVYLCNKDFDFMYKACLSNAEQWQAAGINVVLEFSDWSSQISKAQSMEGWNINQTGLSPRLDPTQLNSSLSSTAAGAYGYSSPDMDALLAEIALGGTNEDRKVIWEKIQAKIWEDVVVLKVGDVFELAALNSKYDGFRSFFVARFWNVTEK